MHGITATPSSTLLFRRLLGGNSILAWYGGFWAPEDSESSYSSAAVNRSVRPWLRDSLTRAGTTLLLVSLVCLAVLGAGDDGDEVCA